MDKLTYDICEKDLNNNLPVLRGIGNKWIVSVIDDDTTNSTYVTNFYNNCNHMGIIGNYAVETSKIENNEDFRNQLLTYEDNGFGMCIHCYYQKGSTDWGNEPYRNLPNCRVNLAKGLRQMQAYGFTNYKCWVAPGGHHDADFQYLARYFGLECLIVTASDTYNKITDDDRYWIKRIALTPSDDTSDGRYAMSILKGYVDDFASDSNGGWLLINTHFNDEGWDGQWDDTLDDNGNPIGYSRFNELIQYCLDKGCEFQSVPEAWSYYKHCIGYNESINYRE